MQAVRLPHRQPCLQDIRGAWPGPSCVHVNRRRRRWPFDFQVEYSSRVIPHSGLRPRIFRDSMLTLGPSKGPPYACNLLTCAERQKERKGADGSSHSSPRVAAHDSSGQWQHLPRADGSSAGTATEPLIMGSETAGMGLLRRHRERTVTDVALALLSTLGNHAWRGCLAGLQLPAGAAGTGAGQTCYV